MPDRATDAMLVDAVRGAAHPLTGGTQDYDPLGNVVLMDIKRCQRTEQIV